MPKLSRMQRYQVLRDRLEEETTESQQDQNTQTLQRLSRSANNNATTILSHANDPRRQNDEDQAVQTITSNLPKSPVMDNLLDEVKQYNMDAGNSVWDDTQINILKQLDGTQSKHRNQHFVPMEEQEELGSTMQLPISKIKDVDQRAKEKQQKEKEEAESKKVEVKEDIKESINDEVGGPTILPMSETPLPMFPLEEEEEVVEEETEVSSDKIVLSSNDFVNDELEETFEMLSPRETYKRPGVKKEEVKNQKEEVIDEPKKPRKPLFAKKEKKVVVKEEKKVTKAPVKKEQKPSKPAVPTVKKAEKKTVSKNDAEKNKAGTILNIVLIVLIILLFIAVIATFMMMRSLAA